MTDLSSFMERCRRETWATYLGNGRIAARALGSYSLVLDANDIGLTPNVICDGFWEPGISVVFERYLKPGMTAVDIGANVGYFTLLMASRVGADGRVVSIEANPALAALLRETLVMNGLVQIVELHNAAAADVPGDLDFYVIPGRNLNGCILLDEWKDRVEPGRTIRVPARPADDILDPSAQVDFIKIDVEGAEHMVWAGLQRTLEANPDILVVLEYNFMRHSKAGSLIPAIESQGFPLRYIDADGVIKPVEREKLFDSDSLSDWMLFLRRGEGTEP